MVEPAGEFETIRELFAPLAHPEWGRGLLDDVAVVPSRPGFDLIATKDAIVEGVHFLPDDPMDTVARKLLRVNLSDLAAKGAEPFGYLLACAWSPRLDWPERQAFAEGLKRDQAAFGVHLLGGDTVCTPGPASFSLTALGWAPAGAAPSRAGARPGDVVVVTGQIGDGGLGLKAARGGLSLDSERIEALIAHYRTPEPKVALADLVLAHANASIDVSDGLLADLTHVLEASGVGADLALERLPLSRAAAAWMEDRVDPEAALLDLATAGDDYEILMAVRPGAVEALRREVERRHDRLTVLGEITARRGLRVTYQGQPVAVGRTGWRHG